MLAAADCATRRGFPEPVLMFFGIEHAVALAFQGFGILYWSDS